MVLIVWLILLVAVVILASRFIDSSRTRRRAGRLEGQVLASDPRSDIRDEEREAAVTDALEAAGEIVLGALNTDGERFRIGAEHQKHYDGRYRASLEVQDAAKEDFVHGHAVAFRVHADFPLDAEAPQVHVSVHGGETVSFRGGFSDEAASAIEAYARAEARAYEDGRTASD